MHQSTVDTDAATTARGSAFRSTSGRALRLTLASGMAVALSLGASLSAQASGTPPIVSDDNFTIATSHALLVDLSELVKNDKAGDGGLLTVNPLASSTPHGSLKFVDYLPLEPYFQYTSADGYTGSDDFSYTVIDSHGNVSATATVFITVVDNCVPVAAADHYSTSPNMALVVGDSSAIGGKGVLANDIDADKDSLQVVAGSVTPTQHGTLSMDPKGGDAFSYLPETNYSGSDSFSYKAQDIYGGVSE